MATSIMVPTMSRQLQRYINMETHRSDILEILPYLGNDYFLHNFCF